MSRKAETRTSGRDATTRHIFGQVALSVGMPSVTPPRGWRWVALTDVARMESGHTPSRNHPEYWDGKVPWIGIRDAKAHHGETIHETIQTTNELGIQNSSARILPQGTVCLSRTASVGYVVTMGKPMATSQDFANWICSNQLDRRFLVYLFIAEKESLLRFASGAIHQTIYYPELKALHICLPPLAEQQRIVTILDEAFAGLATATANAEKNLKNAHELFDGALDFAFQDQKDLVPLSTLATDITDGDHMPPPKAEEGLPFITISNINKDTHEIDFSDTFKVPESYYAGLKANRKPLRGDVLYTVTGSFGIPVVVTTDDRFCFQRHIGLVRPKEGVESRWLYYALRSKFAFDQAASGATGTAQKTVSLKLLRSIQLPRMSQSKQKSVVAKLDGMLKRTQQLNATYRYKIDAVAELKQSILQKAFSGELTSPPPQAIQEAAE